MEWREKDGVRWLEACLGAARVAFGTRLGGTSPAPYASLNLGLLTADAEANVLENRRRLAAALGFAPERVAYALQVHGADLVLVPPSFRGSFADTGSGKEPRADGAGLVEADGQVIGATGVAGLVFTADCLPVAVSGPGGVAMLHCGWRGLAAGILARGVAAVGAEEAAVGPGIGPCCYEVGTEVLDAFAGLGDGVATGRMLDLVEAARRLLSAAGVDRVQSAALCTSCNPELFFSHRRDEGLTGRQGSLAWIAGGES